MTKFRVRRKGSRHKDSGYMLLFLMLAVAVLTITMLGVARNYRREIQRDREVEMIHRGTEYARAVRKYFHKFGRYPVSIEQLENTNNLRFLRKRYKDPMSPDGEWKLAHLTDIVLKPAGGLTAAGGSSAPGSAPGTATDPSSPSQTSFGSNANSANQSSDGTTTGTTTGANPAATGEVLGGGPVMGVVSKSKAEGIHSFGDKNKYNEWFFIYDPSQDTGKSLLVGPYNPNAFVGANTGLGNTNKAPSNPGTPNIGAPATVAPTATTPTTP
jgi:type II secretory pathway pseudopilin PulG